MSETNALPAILELGPEFYDEVRPALFPKAILRYRNQLAASEIGLQDLDSEAWQKHFHAFNPLPENLPHPLALRYHGHQFQHYNPDLGDGRGFLFAQFRTPNRLLDLGTKGSGTTPYSRKGDGRLTLKGAVREILATEMLESLGVPTSRTFSVFETGESLQRHDEPSPTRSAVLVRLNHSHIRFGTFQRLRYLNQPENMQKLLDYCLRHFYFDIQSINGPDRVRLFLEAVATRSAKLAAHWMIAGFVHGVLNTDNMNITGESFDYGPYRFLPEYDPRFTAAYFDNSGLYAYGRQGSVVYWNLYQLGLALQLLEPTLDIEATLDSYAEIFNSTLQQNLLRRLNLKPREEDSNTDLTGSLIVELFNFMGQESLFFEQCLFDLHSGIDDSRLQKSPQAQAYQKASFEKLKTLLNSFTVRSVKIQNNAYFKAPNPCTLLIQEIENIWKEIAEKDDWSLFEKKLAQIRSIRGLYTGS